MNGGRVHDMTLVLNWFLNPNMQVQLNDFLAHRDVADPAGDGSINGWGVRTAIDFWAGDDPAAVTAPRG